MNDTLKDLFDVNLPRAGQFCIERILPDGEEWTPQGYLNDLSDAIAECEDSQHRANTFGTKWIYRVWDTTLGMGMWPILAARGGSDEKSNSPEFEGIKTGGIR